MGVWLGSSTRSATTPDIAIAEQGLPDYDAAGWLAFVGPAKMPAAEVKRIHEAVVAAFASPEVKDAMAKQGNDINPSTPEAAAKFFRSEMERYAKLARKANVQLD